ncbi:hypothetical protein [Streptomyces sp. NPDC056291]|uniref:hypothetical protein n=1 Tax=Streptomyces sp. NPDC056291 TaxID=3345772 RepID=UPI0035DEAC7D
MPQGSGPGPSRTRATTSPAQLARCPPLAQALCLESYADLDMARRWSATWAGLSRACHYHGYELAPTQVELRAWRDDVERVIGALAPRMR